MWRGGGGGVPGPPSHQPVPLQLVQRRQFIVLQVFPWMKYSQKLRVRIARVRIFEKHTDLFDDILLGKFVKSLSCVLNNIIFIRGIREIFRLLHKLFAKISLLHFLFSST